jgi:hypothetical protein
MAFITPKFIGPIVVQASLNDGVAWQETDGVDAYGCATTIAAGTYWPDTLAAAIKAAMEAKSVTHGLGIKYGGTGATYTFTISDTDGTITITVAHGGCTATWFPRCTTGGNWDSVFTGGDVSVSSHGPNHFGFNIQVAFPAYATGHVSDIAHSNAWYPDQPVQEGGDPNRHKLTAESTTAGGKVRGYDFSGDVDYLDAWDLGFRHLSDASRTQYLDEFWQPHAAQGMPDGYFRYYADRTSSIYTEMGLTKESRQDTNFKRSNTGKRVWAMSLQMRKYKS